jgi:hypothetical protein
MKYALVSLAAVSAAAFAAPHAAAQHYSAQSHGYHQSSTMTYEQCVRQQQNRSVTGAVVGGLLGAVAGAQIHNATKPRNTAPPPRRGHRGHRGGRHHHNQPSNQSNAGAVVAGGAIGALAGAAVTGNTNCNQFPRERAVYGHARGYQGGYQQQSYGHQPHHHHQQHQGGYQHQSYGHQQAHSQQSYGYDGYAGNDYGYGYDAYAGGHSGGGLLGGEDYGYQPQSQARIQTAGSGYYAPQAGAACRHMGAGNGAQVLMCQGADGVWRPAY